MSNLEGQSNEPLQINQNDFDTFNNGQGNFSETLEVLGSEKFEAPDLKRGDSIELRIVYKYYNNKGKEVKKPTEEEKQTIKREIKIYTKNKSGKEVNISREDLLKYLGTYNGVNLALFCTNEGAHPITITGEADNFQNLQDFRNFLYPEPEESTTIPEEPPVKIIDNEVDSYPLTEKELNRINDLINSSLGAYNNFKKRHGRAAINKNYDQYTDRKGNKKGKRWEVRTIYSGGGYRTQYEQSNNGINYLNTYTQGNNGELPMVTQDLMNHEIGHSRDPYLILGINGYDHPEIYPQEFREIASRRDIPKGFISRNRGYLFSMPELRADKEALKATLLQKGLRNGKDKFSKEDIDKIKQNKDLYEYNDIGFINRRSIRILQTFTNSQDIADLLNFRQSEQHYKKHIKSSYETILQLQLKEKFGNSIAEISEHINKLQELLKTESAPIDLLGEMRNIFERYHKWFPNSNIPINITEISTWLQEHQGIEIHIGREKIKYSEDTIQKLYTLFNNLFEEVQESYENKKNQYSQNFYHNLKTRLHGDKSILFSTYHRLLQEGQEINTEGSSTGKTNIQNLPIIDSQGNILVANFLPDASQEQIDQYFIKRLDDIKKIAEYHKKFKGKESSQEIDLEKIKQTLNIKNNDEIYSFNDISDTCRYLMNSIYEQFKSSGITEEYVNLQINTGIWNENDQLTKFFRRILQEQAEIQNRIDQNQATPKDQERYEQIKKQLKYHDRREKEDLDFWFLSDEDYAIKKENRYVLLQRTEDSDFTTQTFQANEIKGIEECMGIFDGVEKFEFDTLETTFQSLETDLEAYKELGLIVPKEPMSFGDQFLWILDNQTNGYFTVQLNRLNTKLKEFYQNDNTKGTMDYSTRLSNLANTQHQIQDQ